MTNPRGPKLPAPSGDLTALQDRFIDEYVSNGGKGTAAAKAAGYAAAYASVTANKLLKNPSIVSEVYRRTVLALGASAPGALKTLIDLSTGAKSERIKREASSDLLDRIGIRAPDRVDHRIDGDLRVSIDLS